MPDSSERPKLVSADNLQDYMPCPRNGVWEPVVDLGSTLSKADELIGRLHDFSDHSAPAIEIRVPSGRLCADDASERAAFEGPDACSSSRKN